MKLFGFGKKKKEETPIVVEQPKQILMTSKINGLGYYEDNINALYRAMKRDEVLSKNDDYKMSKKEFCDEFVYGEKVFEYDFEILSARLIHEPIEQDTNAIKVEVSHNEIDWFMIGYVPKKINKQILQILDKTKFDVEWNGYKFKRSKGNEIVVGEEHQFQLQWYEQKENQM